MTQDEIIEMAETCGWGKGNTWDDCIACSTFDLKAFVKLVAAKYEQKIQDLEDMITEIQERQE